MKVPYRPVMKAGPGPAHQDRGQSQLPDEVQHKDHGLHLAGQGADGGGQRDGADDLEAEDDPESFQDFGPQGPALACAVGLREDRERDVWLVSGHDPRTTSVTERGLLEQLIKATL